MNMTLEMEQLYARLDTVNRALIDAATSNTAMRAEVNVHLGMIVDDNAAGRMSPLLLRAYLSGAREIQRKYE